MKVAHHLPPGSRSSEEPRKEPGRVRYSRMMSAETALRWADPSPGEPSTHASREPAPWHLLAELWLSAMTVSLHRHGCSFPNWREHSWQGLEEHMDAMDPTPLSHTQDKCPIWRIMTPALEYVLCVDSRVLRNPDWLRLSKKIFLEHEHQKIISCGPAKTDQKSCQPLLWTLGTLGANQPDIDLH